MILRVVLGTALCLILAGCENPFDLHHYISGPNGGCYYNNDNGNKVYVDRSYCQK